jgi:peptidoglycan/LPS O-acetylase OafA/YrhL
MVIRAVRFAVPLILLSEFLCAGSATHSVRNRLAPDGWIGRWKPGIGDPSVIGWVTVVAYLIAAWYCYRLVRGPLFRWKEREERLWQILALGLLFLGINKQLDLQTALTEAGRLMAREQGWYSERSIVQVAFLFFLFVLGMAGAVAVFRLTRTTSRYAQIAALGAVLLISFVIMRATSFHNVDHMLGEKLAGMRFNWIFELGGILIILVSARQRLSERGRAQERSISHSKSKFY